MDHDLSLKEIKNEWHGTVKSYAIGFIASLLLTSLSFLLVSMEILSGKNLLFTIVGLALTQAVCQLIFFLHLGQETKPRWETVVFYFMFFILLVIALGSLWIMNDLNERVMPSMTKETNHD